MLYRLKQILTKIDKLEDENNHFLSVSHCYITELTDMNTK